MKNIYAVAIIPAKMDSKRLKRKNLRTINGKTLVEITIDYALRFDCVKNVIVSTESDEVAEVCKKYGDKVLVYKEPDHLLTLDTADVYVDIFQNQLEKNGDNDILKKATHVVGLQPDNPDRTTDLDEMLDFFTNKDYDDLFTINQDGTRNGSVRIIKAEYVISGQVSRKIGCILDECTNIHTEEDLEVALRNIKDINNVV